MNQSNIFFTTKTAQGHAFCDRNDERALLKRNIEKGQHSVVVAPRRYGKTSLINKVLQDSGVHFVAIDLFCVVYANDVCSKIVNGVSQLIRAMVPFTKKAIQWMGDCFKNVNIVVKAGGFELKLELNQANFDPVEGIKDILIGLEKVAKKQNKRVVIFIDEFQDLLRADHADRIQATIRSVAQVAEYLCFIFSGSSRYMLKKIFDDRNQPLYMLCEQIRLERISVEEFKKHLQMAAKKRWKTLLEDAVLSDILALTACHPYYVNLLCDRLWESDKPPTVGEVLVAWRDCLSKQMDKLIADLETLNTNRLKVLSKIAILGGVAAPNGKQFVDQVGLPLGSLQKALIFLLDYDYIYRNHEKKLVLVDPLLKTLICMNYV